MLTVLASAKPSKKLVIKSTKNMVKEFLLVKILNRAR